MGDDRDRWLLTLLSRGAPDVLGMPPRQVLPSHLSPGTSALGLGGDLLSSLPFPDGDQGRVGSGPHQDVVCGSGLGTVCPEVSVRENRVISLPSQCMVEPSRNLDETPQSPRPPPTYVLTGGRTSV